MSKQKIGKPIIRTTQVYKSTKENQLIIQGRLNEIINSRAFKELCILMPTARKEDVIGYVALSGNILSNRHCIIGDVEPSGLPDVSSADREIGIEIVSCALPSEYAQYKNTLGPLKKYYNIPKTNFTPQSTFTPDEYEIYYEYYKKNLHRKLTKLNGFSYSGCKDNFLFVYSNFLPKELDINHMYNIWKQTLKDNGNISPTNTENAIRYDQNFKGVIIYANDLLYCFDAKEGISTIRPNSDRFASLSKKR